MQNMEKKPEQGTASRKCLLCGETQHRPIFNDLGIAILQCRACRHVFSSFTAQAQYDQYWGEEVAPGDPLHTFYWNEAHGRMYQDFCTRFLAGRSGRLLDVGCGLGFFLKAIEPYAHWQAYGWEISPAAVRYARDTLGLPNVACGRLEAADWSAASFDIITMWDVIEHILEPDPLLAHCYALLKEGGLCFMHTPNIRIQLPKARLKKLVRGRRPGGNYLEARDHLHHYSTQSMRRLLARHGFYHVDFVHLHPIQSVAGSRSAALRRVKNGWFEVARTLAMVSFGRLNLDNLFVVAHKETSA
jgi:2-polyprenyl-3-methyl-5-hydroxy-6-metoxy-1,4-benzoquinol methylase